MAAPIDMLLSRLPRAKKAGDGWRAPCPSCGADSKSAKLAVSQSSDGRVLLHCFAGCSAAAVLGAIGMELGDLFDRPAPAAATTPEDRVRRRREATMAEWRCAVEVLSVESSVVAAAAAMLAEGSPLDPAELERLNLALVRIDDCAVVLAPQRYARDRAA